jgi:putative mRNA 3-end processing factor
VALLEFTGKGIYCPAGNFFIDPWRPVDYAVITHAHSDHARPGMRTYVAHEHTVPILKYRLGNDISATGYPYNSSFRINGVNVSFHPAGHIIGSAQVRVEYRGEIWVASGDYKLEYDGFSPAFEPVRCHVFISESTFGLPLFKWKPQGEIFSEIGSWWRENAEKDVASVILGYSLGKAQRILQNIDYDAGPVYCHGAIDNINRVISSCGISVRPCERVMPHHSKSSFRKALVIEGSSLIRSGLPQAGWPCGEYAEEGLPTEDLPFRTMPTGTT